MFERYTEQARRTIFFARYEASQFGESEIAVEHILLGLLREDKALMHRFLPGAGENEIRKAIEFRTTKREKVSTSVDMPLTNQSKRVLAYAAEEAERLSHRHIGTEHLLLGLLRENTSFAATLLTERGVKLEQVRQQIAKTPPPQPAETGGGSRVGSAVRISPPVIELVCAGQTVGRVFNSALLPQIPRVGETVVLAGSTYSVEEIIHTFETPREGQPDAYLAHVSIRLKKS